MALQNMNDYISELQTKEDAEKAKWQEYAEKVKSLNSRNSVLGGAARFADSYAALNPVGMKSNYGGAFPDVKESEVLAQNLLDKTKPKDSQAGILRLYQQKMKDEFKFINDTSKKQKFDKEYRLDPQTKYLSDRANQQSILSDLSNMDSNSFSDEMLKTILIKSSGDPRPSDKDRAVYGNNPAILNKAQALYDKLKKGEVFSVRDKEQVREIASVMSKNIIPAYINHNNQWIKKGEITYGFNPETSKELVGAATNLDTSVLEQNQEQNNTVDNEIDVQARKILGL